MNVRTLYRAVLYSRDLLNPMFKVISYAILWTTAVYAEIFIENKNKDGVYYPRKEYQWFSKDLLFSDFSSNLTGLNRQ